MCAANDSRNRLLSIPSLSLSLSLPPLSLSRSPYLIVSRKGVQKPVSFTVRLGYRFTFSFFLAVCFHTKPRGVLSLYKVWLTVYVRKSLAYLSAGSFCSQFSGQMRGNRGQNTERNHTSAVSTPPDIFFLKHESSNLRQSSNHACGSWKSQASSPWAKQHRA